MQTFFAFADTGNVCVCVGNVPLFFFAPGYQNHDPNGAAKGGEEEEEKEEEESREKQEHLQRLRQGRLRPITKFIKVLGH